MEMEQLFGSNKKVCDICHKEKPDVRYADLVRKWICSDCMGVPAFSEAF